MTPIENKEKLSRSVSYGRVTKWYGDDFALGETKNEFVTYVARTEKG